MNLKRLTQNGRFPCFCSFREERGPNTTEQTSVLLHILRNPIDIAHGSDMVEPCFVSEGRSRVSV